MESKVRSLTTEFYNKSSFIEIEGRIDGRTEESSASNSIHFGFSRRESCLLGLGAKCPAAIHRSHTTLSLTPVLSASQPISSILPNPSQGFVQLLPSSPPLRSFPGCQNCCQSLHQSCSGGFFHCRYQSLLGARHACCCILTLILVLSCGGGGREFVPTRWLCFVALLLSWSWNFYCGWTWFYFEFDAVFFYSFLFSESLCIAFCCGVTVAR